MPETGNDLGAHELHRAQHLAVVQAAQARPAQQVGEPVGLLGGGEGLDDRVGIAADHRLASDEIVQVTVAATSRVRTYIS